MSMALPAELNGYPGPSHVLELAEPLKLTEQQKDRTQTLFKQMQEESRAVGAALIAAEIKLGALFKTRRPMQRCCPKQKRSQRPRSGAFARRICGTTCT